MTQDLIAQRLSGLSTSRFRQRFHLSQSDKSMINEKGLPVIEEHAKNLFSSRLFPSWPAKDGKQTPYKGHPVFTAQHASATCCRSCLERWHKIPKGLELGADEQRYVLNVITRWLKMELER